MSAVAVIPPAARERRRRAPGPRHDAEITSRLRKVAGQLAGVQAMYEDERYCIDVLDQLSAITGAIDSVALLILEDHITACVRQSLSRGETDASVNELVSSLRRYLRRR